MEYRLNASSAKPFLDTDITDADHPLIQLLFKGEPVFWQNLQQGSYINNAAMRGFISQLPVNTGLYSLPIYDVNHKACGTIILLGQAEELENIEQGIFLFIVNYLIIN
ncbi:hypothetical protein I3679_010820 [Proteus mirabilis]|uniref:Uncharacterized protein n=1 Tax=Proteus mirabilis TaxID=584 RepID=A0ABD5M0I6_PROMI